MYQNLKENIVKREERGKTETQTDSAHTYTQGRFIMLSGGLSRQYSNSAALNGGPCRRGQERAEAEGRKVHGCHSYKSVSLFLVLEQLPGPQM